MSAREVGRAPVPPGEPWYAYVVHRCPAGCWHVVVTSHVDPEPDSSPPVPSEEVAFRGLSIIAAGVADKIAHRPHLN